MKRTTLLLILIVSGSATAQVKRWRSTTVFAEAVRVKDRALVHTTQLIPHSGDLTAQVGQLIDQLTSICAEFRTTPDQVVKLNFYVTTKSASSTVRRVCAERFQPNRRPAVSFVVTPLASPFQVAVDAVIATQHGSDRVRLKKLTGIKTQQPSTFTHCSLLPRGDVIYISGQAAPGNLSSATEKTLAGLHRTLRNLKLNWQHVVSIKTFMTPVKQRATVDGAIEKVIGRSLIPPVSHVEWKSGGSYPIEIELIAFAPKSKSKSNVTYFTPPWMKASPVFSRVARIHGSARIYLSERTSKGDLAAMFKGIQATLFLTGSDIRHLAKATYYVTTPQISSRLNQIRPRIYDPQRPPAASKAMVQGVGQGTLAMDLIAAPK